MLIGCGYLSVAVYVTTWKGPGANTIVLFSWIARLSACPMWCTGDPMPALAQHMSSQQQSSSTEMSIAAIAAEHCCFTIVWRLGGCISQTTCRRGGLSVVAL